MENQNDGHGWYPTEIYEASHNFYTKLEMKMRYILSFENKSTVHSKTNGIGSLHY